MTTKSDADNILERESIIPEPLLSIAMNVMVIIATHLSTPNHIKDTLAYCAHQHQARSLQLSFGLINANGHSAQSREG